MLEPIWVLQGLNLQKIPTHFLYIFESEYELFLEKKHKKNKLAVRISSTFLKFSQLIQKVAVKKEKEKKK